MRKCYVLVFVGCGGCCYVSYVIMSNVVVVKCVVVSCSGVRLCRLMWMNGNVDVYEMIVNVIVVVVMSGCCVLCDVGDEMVFMW